MTQAFILIPGGRLPADVASDVLNRCSLEEKHALTTIGAGAGQAVEQTLDTAVYRRAPHLVWLWRVITRRPAPPQEAPWRWLALGGREQATQFWSVDPITLVDGRISKVTPELSFDEFMKLTIAVEPLFMKAGFRMQMWDNIWFGTRKEDWQVVTAPRMAMTGLTIDELPITGDEADAARQLFRAVAEVLKDHPVNIEREKAGLPRIDALWVSGGGHEQLFFPPTLIRSVASNDAAVRGWANASSILIERIGKNTGDWPEAPSGDVIAEADELYDAWLRQDWDAWRAELPAVARKVTDYREHAKRFGVDTTLVIAFGDGRSVTLAPEGKSLLKKLFGNAGGLDAKEWCSEGVLTE